MKRRLRTSFFICRNDFAANAQLSVRIASPPDHDDLNDRFTGLRRRRQLPGRQPPLLRRAHRPAGQGKAVEPADRQDRVAAGTPDGSDARQVQGARTAHGRAGPHRRRKTPRSPTASTAGPQACCARARTPTCRARWSTASSSTSACRRPPCACGTSTPQHAGQLVRRRRVGRRAHLRQQPAGALLRQQPRLRSGALAG